MTAYATDKMSMRNPCPFCASESCYVHKNTGAEELYVYTVMCEQCLARGPCHETPEQARTAWEMGEIRHGDPESAPAQPTAPACEHPMYPEWDRRVWTGD